MEIVSRLADGGHKQKRLTSKSIHFRGNRPDVEREGAEAQRTWLRQ